MEIWTIISSIGIFLLMLSYLPQLFRLYKTKSSGDVSIGTWTLVLLGCLALLARAIYDAKATFIINYIVGSILSMAIMVLVLIYNGKKANQNL